MSRILRHVGHKDFQKTRQRQIGEQKELAAKKLKEDAKRKELEEAARPYKSNWRDELVVPVPEEVEVQEPKVNTILKVNREKGGVVSDEFVRKVVSEGMTSSGMFQTTLPAQSEPLQSVVIPDSTISSTNSSHTSGGGGTGYNTGLNLGAGSQVTISGSSDTKTFEIGPLDTSTATTITLRYQQGDYNNGGTANTSGTFIYFRGPDSYLRLIEYIPPNYVNYFGYESSEHPDYPFMPGLFDTMTSAQESELRSDYTNYIVNGFKFSDQMQIYAKIVRFLGKENAIKTATFNIPPELRGKNAQIYLRQNSNIGTPWTNDFAFSNFELKRLAPINVFVSLDTPEATAFIRTDPIMRGLSAAERYKKLEDLLDAGDEYALKALGMQTSGTRPADTGNVKSWDQAANEVDYGTDLTPLSDNPYGTELGQIAMAGDMDMGGLGLLGMGAEALAAIVTLGVAGLMQTYNMSKEMATWLVNKYDASPGQAERDAQDYERGTSEQQKQETAAADKQLQDATAELEAANASGDPERIERAEERRANAVKNRQRVRNKWKTNRQNQKNSYEPVGEVLTEKKKLKSPKDLQNKIPGYYDGKPAPLGFPMEPPAKMVNGFHADLVTPEGQEKQSNRYNRMDQATAKAMPMTDNPYINKKIIKARLQPK